MPLTDLRVTPYRAELEGDIARLWEESRGPSGVQHRLALFRWFTDKNPFLRGRPAYWCLQDGVRVIGMHGHMPLVFDVDGRECLGHMGQDDLLHPSARGRGLGQALLAGVRTAAPHFAAVMWLNAANHRSYTKAGWIDVPGFRYYVRFLHAGRLAAKCSDRACAYLVRAAGPVALQLIDVSGRLRRRGDLRVVPIQRFDHSFDALWDRAKRRLGIAARRSAEYLNWRYVAMPAQCHVRRAAVTRDEHVVGYVVWRLTHAGEALVVRVLDVLWDPHEHGVLESLLLSAVEAARDQGASEVLCAGSHPVLVRALRALGFLTSPREEPYMVSNWEGQFALAEVTNIDRWHLTLGDADGDIWSET